MANLKMWKIGASKQMAEFPFDKDGKIIPRQNCIKLETTLDTHTKDTLQKPENKLDP